MVPLWCTVEYVAPFWFIEQYGATRVHCRICCNILVHEAIWCHRGAMRSNKFPQLPPGANRYSQLPMFDFELQICSNPKVLCLPLHKSSQIHTVWMNELVSGWFFKETEPIVIIQSLFFGNVGGSQGPKPLSSFYNDSGEVQIKGSCLRYYILRRSLL